MEIHVHDLTKRYGSTIALDGVSSEIAAGQIVALLGPNGAGKTSLLKCISGMAIPETGEIRFDGELFQRDNAGQRRRLHFMPDLPSLLPNKPMVRNLTTMLRLYERDSPGMASRLVELLEEFDILKVANNSMSQLSRGQEYKATLVGLIACDPELWLLDEPFASGMDPIGLDAFRKHARAATERGHTVVYSTQLLELAEGFSDRMCVIADGRIAAEGTVNELKAEHGDGKGDLSALFRSLRERSEEDR